jgi:hypothetical protein
MQIRKKWLHQMENFLTYSLKNIIWHLSDICILNVSESEEEKDAEWWYRHSYRE